MINKKFLCIMLIISIFAISAVSASDNVTQDVVNLEVDDALEIETEQDVNAIEDVES